MTDPKVELNLNGVWTDITTYTASVRSQVTIIRGRSDETKTADPSRCTFALNNRDGRFSPRNPTGPYYGVIGRNTPLRVSVPGKGYRFHGEVSAWPTTWDESGQDAWTTITGSGITRRLSQGSPPLAGPIPRYMNSAGVLSTLLAYWPMTDVATATTVASGLPGGSPLALEGASLPRLAASTAFPSSDPVPVLNAGTFTGTPIWPGPGVSYYTTFLLAVPAAADTNDAVLYRQLMSGSAFRWEIRYFASGSLQLRAFDNLGASLLTSALGANLNGVPVLVRFGLSQSGGNISWFLVTFNYATGAVIDALSGSFAGTMGNVTLNQFNADRALVNTAVGQLAIFYTTDPYPLVLDAYRGYSGETAGARFVRLCGEEGVPQVTVGTLAATELMGPQQAGSLLDLLRECEASDMGHLFEPRDSFGLGYRTRESMYNQAVDLALTYSQMRNLQPVEDDQNTRNDVTVTRNYGSSARSVLSTGPLSILAPPNGVGRYQNAVTLSLASDAQLQPQADWRVTLGTVDEPRYPVIRTEIQALPATPQGQAIAADVGDLATVTGTPVWIPPGGVAALIYGYTERIAPEAWDIEFNCLPASPYNDVFTLDDATLGRLDATTSVTNGALTTTATNVPHTGEVWTTTPGDFPLDIVIGGEVMRATANSGTAFTVTRSINGVVKSHLSGAPIRVATPAQLAL